MRARVQERGRESRMIKAARGAGAPDPLAGESRYARASERDSLSIWSNPVRAALSLNYVGRLRGLSTELGRDIHGTKDLEREADADWKGCQPTQHPYS